MRRTRIGLIVALAGAVVAATPAGAGERWWGGGGIGLSFGGQVDWISVEPVLGYWVTDDFTVGARAIFRYRDDNRFDPDLSTTDYGASLFGRYLLADHWFVQGEYEYLSYEFRTSSNSTDREAFGSWLAGGGYTQQLSPHASFFASALYNLSYDEDELSPYDGPWVIRASFGFRF